MTVQQGFTPAQCHQFQQQGFMVAPKLAPAALLWQLQRLAQEEDRLRTPPLELEASTGYPGAPAGVAAEGGQTPRRLLQAYARHELLRCWAHHPRVKHRLQTLFNTEAVFLNPNHHNCLMTKHTRFSSLTQWHQDVRYWSFSDQNLVNVWLALGKERKDNGGMQLVPSSHHWQLAEEHFDQALFLRQELAENQQRLDQAKALELEPGDVLFFHATLFHSAGANRSDQTKYSLVYTYHPAHTRPLANTRSAEQAPIAL